MNTSRAQIVAQGALVEALTLGRRGRAAVDVYEEKPVTGAAHPLIGLPNALCTPHLGYVEESVYAALDETAIEQLVAYSTGAPINVVEAPPAG